jgi:O-antigen/teichoic acid export membrane protein
MPNVGFNIMANMVGNAWNVVLNLAAVPAYVAFMGIESFGLVGFFNSLFGVCAVLDLGMGATMNREMARLQALPSKDVKMRDTLRTLELTYWIIAVLIGSAVVVAAPAISTYWFQLNDLSTRTVTESVMLMGVIISVRLPFVLYQNGLLGIQKQVLLNIIIVVWGTLRVALSLLVLWKISSTIRAFLLCQAAVEIARTSSVAFVLRCSLPSPRIRTKFRLEILHDTGRFALGSAGISITGMLFIQMDKILLSKLLTMKAFGYYSLASTVAVTGFYSLITPFFNAYYPKITEIVSLRRVDELRKVYHLYSQAVSITVLPAATLIALFSGEIIQAWTGDIISAKECSTLVSFMIVGTALNGLMQVPYSLQLAEGWTSLALRCNFIMGMFLIPLLLVLVNWYGAIGGALTWLIVNTIYVLVAIQLMHTRLLPTEKWAWYFNDVLKPLLGSLLIGIAGRLFFPEGISRSPTVFYLFALLLLAIFVSSSLAGEIRVCGIRLLRSVLDRKNR